MSEVQRVPNAHSISGKGKVNNKEIVRSGDVLRFPLSEGCSNKRCPSRTLVPFSGCLSIIVVSFRSGRWSSSIRRYTHESSRLLTASWLSRRLNL